jgi:glycosyltransferase involved in cell wall biosynthesis
MEISIVTAALNNKFYIWSCIESVLSQTYRNIEHIIIDGGSTDGTPKVLEKYKDKIAKIISEPDRGIYDALNKGIKLASGDVIGLLNGDDFYAHDKVLETVMSVFEKQNVDSCYGDLEYVDKNDTNKVIRHWKSSEYRHGKFRYGWMPPHPTFFVKRRIYEKFGYFNTNFRIAADYELMLRFLEGKRITTHYIPHVLIKMRVGGVSNRSLRNLVLKSYEDYKAWRVNQLNSRFYTIFFKNLSKIPQFFLG